MEEYDGLHRVQVAGSVHNKKGEEMVRGTTSESEKIDSELISQLLYNMPPGDQASVLSACLSLMFKGNILCEMSDCVCRLRINDVDGRDEEIVDTVLAIWDIDDNERKRKKFVVCEAYGIVEFKTQKAYGG